MPFGCLIGEDTFTTSLLHLLANNRINPSVWQNTGAQGTAIYFESHVPLASEKCLGRSFLGEVAPNIR